MKRLLLLCLMFVCAFAVQSEKKEIPAQVPYQTLNSSEEGTWTVNPIIKQMMQARKDGDMKTYNKLLELYKSQIPLGDGTVQGIQECRHEDNPSIRWNGDRIIYSGDVAYNSWSIDDEEISVEHFRGDTLRAAVVLTDSTIQIFQSNDMGLNWFGLGGWWWAGHAVYEPEIISDPNGMVYHVATRWTANNGDIIVITDSLSGNWYSRQVDAVQDTVLNYSICSDRSQYPGSYFLFVAYEKDLGGQGENEIWFSRSFDESVTWETPEALLVNGASMPDLAFGYDDYLYLARIFDSSNDTDYVRVNVSSDEGSNWGGSITIQKDTMSKLRPKIAAAHDGSGDLWLTWPRMWTYGPDYDLYYSWSQDNNASWSLPAFVSAGVDIHDILPSISIYDAEGGYTPHLSFIETDTSLDNTEIKTIYWDSDSAWAAESTYNDNEPGLIRPCQTWEAPGFPALAYVGANGVNVYYDSWSMTYGVEEGNAQISVGKVYMQNRPNPFHTNTLLEYNVPVSGMVTLKIYNPLGQEVAKLVDEHRSAGTYTYNWNGHALPKGVYFAKLQVGTMNAARKIIVQ